VGEFPVCSGCFSVTALLPALELQGLSGVVRLALARSPAISLDPLPTRDPEAPQPLPASDEPGLKRLTAIAPGCPKAAPVRAAAPHWSPADRGGICPGPGTRCASRRSDPAARTPVSGRQRRRFPVPVCRQPHSGRLRFSSSRDAIRGRVFAAARVAVQPAADRGSAESAGLQLPDRAEADAACRLQRAPSRCTLSLGQASWRGLPVALAPGSTGWSASRATLH
jgi:hypothetical protein